METKHIAKRHNKSLLLYHLVCPVKYRRNIFIEEVEKTLKNICKQIEQKHEIYFIEIGSDSERKYINSAF